VANAWRTVSRVNAAALRPGDTVLFEGGTTFTDETLEPSRSGRRKRPITYGSYGGGHARLPRGIKLEDVNWIAIRGFTVSGGSEAVIGSPDGSGARHVTIEHNLLHNVDVGVYSANPRDAGWTIRDNTISQTGDSGMILYGSDFSITGNSITDTGTDSSISYAKHGIYLKVVGARVTGNTIRRFHANGVSVRYRNSVIDDNVIADGPIGIAWFQYDPTPGTSYWRHNTISGTTSANVYVSSSDIGGPTRESFVITDNRLSKRSGVYTNLKPTTGRYTVRGNRQN
jgi:parallel beta-helix repeat protein